MPICGPRESTCKMTPSRQIMALMGSCTWSTYHTSQSLVPAISSLAQASEAHFTDGGGEGPMK